MDSKITIHAEKSGFLLFLEKLRIRETGDDFLRRRISSLQDKRHMEFTDFTCPSSRYLFWQHNGCINRIMTQNHLQTASRIHFTNFLIFYSPLPCLSLKTFANPNTYFHFLFIFTPGIYKNCVSNSI